MQSSPSGPCSSPHWCIYLGLACEIANKHLKNLCQLQVQNASSVAPSSTSSQPAQQSQGHAGAAAAALPAAGSVVAPHPQASHDRPPGYPSAISTLGASTAQRSVSAGQNGHSTALDGSDSVQPTHVPLFPNRHGTWSSDGEEDTPAHASDHDAPPGYGTPGPAPHRRSSAVAPVSLLRDVGRMSVQSGTDHPPGFANRAAGPDKTAAVPTSTEGHPPGFALSTQPHPHAHPGAVHSTADQPSGFHQPGSLLPSVGIAQSNTPDAASFAQFAKPADNPISGRSSGKASSKGRAQASAPLDPQVSSSASQLPTAATTAPAELPPGFPAPSSPSFQHAEDHPTGTALTRSQGRSATSSRIPTRAAGQHLHTAGTAETPPGFGGAGIGSAERDIQGSQQRIAGALRPQKAAQVVGGELPPGFPTRSQASAVQSASSQGQLPRSQASLPSPSATAEDDLPPGFLAHAQSSSRRHAPVAPPPHAPRMVSVTRLPSGHTAELRSTDQPAMPASAADDLPPGFPVAPSAAPAPVLHSGSSPARRASSTASHNASVPTDGPSGWDIDEAELTAAASQAHRPVRYQHTSAVDDDPPPGFPAAPLLVVGQQPASASRPAHSSSQWQAHVVAPLLERKGSVTKLAATPVSGPSVPPTVHAHPPRGVPVSRVPAPPSSGPTNTPQSSSMASKKKTHSQAMLQSPVVAGDTTPDLPPGFSTMQRSASTPGASAGVAHVNRGTAVDASGTAAHVVSSDAADLPPGFDTARKGLSDLPPGFPADRGPVQSSGHVGVSKSSRKDAGRRAETHLPPAGMPRSDARRKALIPKVSCPVFPSVIRSCKRYQVYACFCLYGISGQGPDHKKLQLTPEVGSGTAFTFSDLHQNRRF